MFLDPKIQTDAIGRLTLNPESSPAPGKPGRWSLSWWAEELGVDKSELSRMHHGQRPMQIELLAAMCQRAEAQRPEAVRLIREDVGSIFAPRTDTLEATAAEICARNLLGRLGGDVGTLAYIVADGRVDQAEAATLLPAVRARLEEMAQFERALTALAGGGLRAVP